jgi:hypothetical protein
VPLIQQLLGFGIGADRADALLAISLANLRLKGMQANATPESRPTARLWVSSITAISLLGTWRIRLILRIERQLEVLIAIMLITHTRMANGELTTLPMH